MIGFSSARDREIKAGFSSPPCRQRSRRPAGVVSSLLFLAAASLMAQPQAPSILEALRLAREAAAAAEANDAAASLARMEAAVALRPDLPKLLVDLAAAQVAAEREDDAIATLQGLAKMGVSSPIDKSEDFAALRPRKDFQEIVKRLATNLHPKGEGEIAFTLRDVTGLIEGIAWREKTAEFYFGDVNGRAVWHRAKDGTLRRLTPAGDELLGVFGLAIDEANGALWAATAAVPAMSGFSPEQNGAAALTEIDLASGAVRQTFPVAMRDAERGHQLGDVALAADGSVFVTDRATPVLWRLAPGGRALEVFAESPEFLSLQGIVVLPEGYAIVADQVNGLLRIDLANRRVLRLEPPPDTTLIGIQGLATNAGGDVFALQTGTRPVRVLRLKLGDGGESVNAVHMLESGHLAMAAPSQGCVATGGDFFFIGNPGWNRFAADDGRPTAPRPVPVFRTKLGKR